MLDMFTKGVLQTMSEDWIIEVEEARTTMSGSLSLAIAFLLVLRLGPFLAVAWNKVLVWNGSQQMARTRIRAMLWKSATG